MEGEKCAFGNRSFFVNVLLSCAYANVILFTSRHITSQHVKFLHDVIFSFGPVPFATLIQNNISYCDQ